MTDDSDTDEDNLGWMEECTVEEGVDNCHSDYVCNEESKTCWGLLCAVD